MKQAVGLNCISVPTASLELQLSFVRYKPFARKGSYKPARDLLTPEPLSNILRLGKSGIKKRQGMGLTWQLSHGGCVWLRAHLHGKALPFWRRLHTKLVSTPLTLNTGNVQENPILWTCSAASPGFPGAWRRRIPAAWTKWGSRSLESRQSHLKLFCLYLLLLNLLWG